MDGVKAAGSPIAIGTCTTILAFLPFLFVRPAGYQLVNAVPYVAFIALSISLIEAFLILPALPSHKGRWSHWPLSAL